MANSVVEVWNLALRRLGHTVVSSEDENSDEASLLREVWPINRDRFLENYDWPFARRYGLLTPINDDDELIDGWLYAYEEPQGDMLAFRGIVDPSFTGGELMPFERCLRVDSDEMKILCDVEDATGVWTVRRTDVSRFPESFTLALSWACQADLVESIIRDDPKGVRVAQYLKAATDIAMVSTSRSERQRKAAGGVPNSIAARA